MIRRIPANVRRLWVRQPVAAIAAWAGFAWFVSLASNPAPTSRVHVLMAELAPLPVWGGFAGAIFLGVLIANQGWVRGVRLQYVLAYAAFFFGCVGGVFLTSGASLTGWGTYLSLAAGCFSASHSCWVQHD